MLKDSVWADEAARTRIAEELQTTFLVEAGAGSGKTASLVRRMIALVRTGTAPVQELAAITFTNKAASELAGRFRIQLEQELGRTAPGPERDALAEALRRLAECFIGTIHAFCGRLLRERPIEARVDPAFRELEEAEDEAFRDRMWDEYLEGLRGEEAGERSFEELAALDVSLEELREVYVRVSQNPDVTLVTEAVEGPDHGALRDSLLPLLEEASAYLPAAAPEKGWDDLQNAIRQASRLIRSLDTREARSVLALARLFDRTLKVTQNRWTEAKKGKHYHEVFLNWQQTKLAPYLQRWREFLHPKLITFVQPAVRYCTDRRMAGGRLNFQDLLMKAAELLRTYPEVRRYFGARYRRLFVDEFQDTDPIQAEVMLLLTGSDPDQPDWRRQLPRPGSLFVVGDPKQSIYRFRRADITTYNFVKERIALCGAVLQLTSNFRSVKSIGDFVNYAFESKFILPGQPLDAQAQAPFVRMETRRPNPGGRAARHGVFRLTVPKQERDRQDAIALEDAERIAQYIAWACDGNLIVQERAGEQAKPVTRPAGPGDFLILLRHRKWIQLYAERLERYGIAADTSGSAARFGELQVLHHLACVFADSTDPVPLLAILRGPLFGLSDDELYHYRREGGRLYLDSEVEAEQLSEKGATVQQALRMLSECAGWVKALPALAAFTRIVHALGIVPAAASGESGALRSGTLIRVLETLQGDPEACLDWPALTRRLERWAAGQGLETASLFSGSEAAVRLMNLHKAKGLEAPCVFLACPCGDQDHDAAEHVDRSADPPAGYFAVTKPKPPYGRELVAHPVGWTAWAERERTFQHAEAERLLYVAATRAQQLLVVSQYPSKPAIDPWRLLATALQRQLELEPAPMDPVEPEVLPAAPAVEAALGQWSRLRARSAAATYRAGSVTGTAHAAAGPEPALEPERPSDGRGMAFGRLVHRCLQAVGEGLPPAELPAYGRMAAEEEGVEARWLPEAEAAVRQVLASELWRRAEAALSKHHEFAFLSVRETEPSVSGLPQPSLLRGVIDLVFEEPDGWVIADFKTDRFAPEQEALLTAFYEPQVRAYADEWRRTVGGRVKEAGLYFIDCHRYVALDMH